MTIKTKFMHNEVKAKSSLIIQPWQVTGTEREGGSCSQDVDKQGKCLVRWVILNNTDEILWRHKK